MKNTELFPKSSFLFVLSAFVAEFILKVISIIIIQYSPPPQCSSSRSFLRLILLFSVPVSYKQPMSGSTVLQ